MKRIVVNYDETTGNILINGLAFYIGVGIANLEEAVQTNTIVKPSERELIINKAMNAEELIKLRKMGVL